MNTRSTLTAMLGTVTILALVTLAISIRFTGAYPSYSDGSTSLYCAQCHETAVGGGFQSRGPLHDAHNASATATCTLCHEQQGDIPVLPKCIGCHGQPGTTGAGLRKHHALAGAPADGDGLVCSDCHSDPAPAPESAVPPYYGQPDVQQTSPCNADGKEDFWSFATGAPDGKGLDNDGDLLVDAADPDCAPPLCIDNDGDGYGNPGHATCPNGPAQDCNDSSNAAYPGAPEVYDLIDNDCNTEVDEIKNVRFADPANADRVSWDAQLPAVQIYDVIRSDGSQFPPASPNTICLGNNVAVTALDDLATPAVGQVFFYLVRNSLVGDYGKRSDGALRVYAACP